VNAHGKCVLHVLVVSASYSPQNLEQKASAMNMYVQNTFDMCYMKKEYIFLTIFICCCIILAFFLRKAVYAENPSIIISEVGAHEKNNNEWIEITNISSSSVSLNNWKFFENGTAHAMTLVQGTSTLHAHDTALVVQNSDAFFLHYPSTTVSVFDSSWGSLKMSGEEISLVDETGDRVDNIFYVTSTGFSLERIGPGYYDWKEHVVSSSIGVFSNFTNTPQNIFVTTSVSSSTELVVDDVADIFVSSSIIIPEIVLVTSSVSTTTLVVTSTVTSTVKSEVAVVEQPEYVYLSEFVPYPYTGKKEWVELFFGGTVSTSVVGWSFHDEKGEVLALDTVLSPGTYTIIEFNSNVLNNSGDTLTLFDAAGEKRASVKYGKDSSVGSIARGWSVVRNGDAYVSSAVATPGKKNSIAASGSTKSISKKTSPKKAVEALNTIPIGALEISEIYSSPASGKEEYVEIRNTTAETISLAGLHVLEGSGAKTRLEGSLKPFDFIVVESIKGKLNNTGDRVSLQQGLQVLDDVIYGTWNDVTSNIPAPKKGESIMKEGNIFLVTKMPTPGERNYLHIAQEEKETENVQNISATNETFVVTTTLAKNDLPKILKKSIQKKEIWITEIFPNPFGSDEQEYIELYNPGDEPIQLSGYALDDGEGGSAPYVFDGSATLFAGTYGVYKKTQTGISLNNSVDSARVLFDGEQIASVGYRDVKEGGSYAKFGSIWGWTSVSTPGKQNVNVPFTSVRKVRRTAQPAKVHISETLLMDDNAYVTVEGVVQALPGEVNSRTMVIAAEGAGIEVYQHGKQFPALLHGQQVRVIGHISTTKNGNRINVSNKNDISISVAGEAKERVVSIDHIASVPSYQRIRTQGIVDHADGGVMIFDGGSALRVTLSEGASGIVLPQGAEVEMTGLLLKKEEEVLLVTKASDISVISLPEVQPQIQKEKKSFFPAVLFTVLIIGAIVRQLYVKKNVQSEQ